MEQKPQQGNSSDVIKVRYEKLDALKEAGRDPFVITTSDRDILTETIKNNFEEYENKDVCVAGRLLSKRGKGKVSFMDLWDRSGKIQIFAKFDDLGEEEYGFLKKWDIGDIVEIKGFVFKTQMGEISVHAKEVKLLSKSLKPLPEKYHGLTNTDLRYRQRYVDLIMNPEVRIPLSSVLRLSAQFVSILIHRALWRLKLLCSFQMLVVHLQDHLKHTSMLLMRT